MVVLVVKRMMDIVFSTLMLLVLCPIMLMLALLVLVTMGRPVIFRQRRPGLHGRSFTLYKFRSMRDALGEDGRPLPDSERRTPVGVLIRKLSLDELPELFNVLKGDMSLVGPRPLLEEYLSHYTPEQARRHNVRPGITGLAQISGRHSIPFSKRLELDVYYVDNYSPWLDLKILLGTIPSLIGMRGVTEGGRVAEVEVNDLGFIPEYISGKSKDKEPDVEA